MLKLNGINVPTMAPGAEVLYPRNLLREAERIATGGKRTSWLTPEPEKEPDPAGADNRLQSAYNWAVNQTAPEKVEKAWFRFWCLHAKEAKTEKEREAADRAAEIWRVKIEARAGK